MIDGKKFITFDEIQRILDRSWEATNKQFKDSYLEATIGDIIFLIQQSYSEYGEIKIITPLRTLVFQTWFESPYELIDNDVFTEYTQWDEDFFNQIRSITMKLYELSRQLQPAYFLYSLERVHIKSNHRR